MFPLVRHDSCALKHPADTLHCLADQGLVISRVDSDVTSCLAIAAHIGEAAAGKVEFHYLAHSLICADSEFIKVLPHRHCQSLIRSLGAHVSALARAGAHLSRTVELEALLRTCARQIV